jgi:hypothetical protein
MGQRAISPVDDRLAGGYIHLVTGSELGRAWCNRILNDFGGDLRREGFSGQSCIPVASPARADQGADFDQLPGLGKGTARVTRL